MCVHAVLPHAKAQSSETWSSLRERLLAGAFEVPIGFSGAVAERPRSNGLYFIGLS